MQIIYVAQDLVGSEYPTLYELYVNLYKLQHKDFLGRQFIVPNSTIS